MKRVLPVAATLAWAACTFSDGGPFATLDARVESRLVVPSGRDASGGFQKLDTDYQVRFSELGVTVDAVDLRAASAPGAGFDPANPPAGYSLCHGGHCHRDDGALIAYEDIAAGLSGGTGARTIVSLPVGELDLVAMTSRPVACQPSCDLPRADITAASAGITRLRMAGELRDGRAMPRIAAPIAFRLDVTLAGAVLDGRPDLPADRDHDPDVSLTIGIELSGQLLDGIDVGALVLDAGGVADLGAAANQAALAAIRENVAKTALVLTTER